MTETWICDEAKLEGAKKKEINDKYTEIEKERNSHKKPKYSNGGKMNKICAKNNETANELE